VSKDCVALRKVISPEIEIYNYKPDRKQQSSLLSFPVELGGQPTLPRKNTVRAIIERDPQNHRTFLREDITPERFRNKKNN